MSYYRYQRSGSYYSALKRTEVPVGTPIPLSHILSLMGEGLKIQALTAFRGMSRPYSPAHQRGFSFAHPKRRRH